MGRFAKRLAAARARADRSQVPRGELEFPHRPPALVHRNFPGGPVLVIGDSHTWMAGAGGQYPAWDTDCRAGRTTAEGVEVVAANLAARHRVVVFDMATNDDEVPVAGHWKMLLELRHRLGRRQLVLVSSWRLDKSLEHVVRNHRRLATDDPFSTSVADWAGFLAHHPDLFVDDRVHFTEEALLVRTGIIWTAVRAAEIRATSPSLGERGHAIDSGEGVGQ